MRVFAPGKIVLTGAYAVLEGAPAIVLATRRGAYADASRVEARPSLEVRAAFGDAPAPTVDASELFVDGRKLGLGSSAAVLVASLAARDAARGKDLADAAYRRALFVDARRAHGDAQGGGSGVDVAASVYGGVVCYRIDAPKVARLPREAIVTVLACAKSARTSELRGAVDRLARERPAVHRARMDSLRDIAERSAAAVEEEDARAFVDAIDRAGRALEALGAEAGAQIVPPEVAALSEAARAVGAAFSVAGAGGGDVAIHVGQAPPDADFLADAKALGLTPVDCGVDVGGVRLV